MQTIINLQKPLIGLSPMDGVTDAAFRIITKKYGQPDLMYTEFVNVMGLCIAGFNTLKELRYDEVERPIIGQIYGKDPDYFYHAAKIICALGFDGIDINMGCPAKTVSNSGSGAALIRTPDLAREIIEATRNGANDWAKDGKLTGLTPKTLEAVEHMIDEKRSSARQVVSNQIYPGLQNLTSEERIVLTVSVKTRIGYDIPVTEAWIKNLTKAKPAWIAVHGRTLKQMYTGRADRTELKKAVASTDLPVLVNGDIETYSEALDVIDESGAFGALIGRGSFGNPWAFLSGTYKEVEIAKRAEVMLEHTKLFVQMNPDPKAFFQMRKHFGWYMKGFDGAKEVREKLMRSTSVEEVAEIIQHTVF